MSEIIEDDPMIKVRKLFVLVQAELNANNNRYLNLLDHALIERVSESRSIDINFNQIGLNYFPVSLKKITEIIPIRTIDLNDNCFKSMTGIDIECETLKLSGNNIRNLLLDTMRCETLLITNSNVHSIEITKPNSTLKIIGLTTNHIKNEDLVKIIEFIPNISQIMINKNPWITKLPDISVSQDLTYLEASNCMIETIEKFSKTNQKLKILHLENNRIDELPMSIDNLQDLIWLDLGNNKLTAISSSIGNIVKLSSLYLNDNFINFLPKEICNLKLLQSLDVSNNPLRDLPDDIGNLVDLEILNLSNTDLISLPRSIGKLKKLEKINLIGTSITYIQDFPAEFRSSIDGTRVPLTEESIGLVVPLSSIDRYVGPYDIQYKHFSVKGKTGQYVIDRDDYLKAVVLVVEDSDTHTSIKKFIRRQQHE